MRLAKVNISLEDRFKVIVLLDINPKINIIIKKLIEDANLVIKQGPKFEMVLNIGHNWLF